MRTRRTRRAITTVLGLVATMSLASGCLAVDGPVHRITYYDGADPSGQIVYWNTIRVYTTSLFDYNIPTYNLFVDSKTIGPVTDAMPTRPSWSTSAVWAPTSGRVAGIYMLLFTTGRAGGGNCIGAAQSTTPEGPYTPIDWIQWCDPNPNVGWLDPEFFWDEDIGELWLYWSRIRHAGSGGSDIVGQRLLGTGGSLERYGTMYTLLTYDQAVQASPGDPGNFPVVENPNMVKDEYNAYDLLFSVGSWDSHGYRTGEVACNRHFTECFPAQGGTLLSTNGDVAGPGGASTVQDNSAFGHMLFAGYSGSANPGSRALYYAKTKAMDPLPDSVASIGPAEDATPLRPAEPLAAVEVAKPFSEYPSRTPT